MVLLPASLAKCSMSARLVKHFSILARFSSVSLFLLPPRTNSAEASIKRVFVVVGDLPDGSVQFGAFLFFDH